MVSRIVKNSASADDVLRFLGSEHPNCLTHAVISAGAAALISGGHERKYTKWLVLP